MTELKINGKVYQVNAEEDTPLLWAIRDSIGLAVPSMAAGFSSVVLARFLSRAGRSALAE